MFKKKPVITFDPSKETPAVKRSICTGEMTVGFVEKDTGKFRDLMCAKNPKELEDFCKRVGVSSEELKTIY